MIWIVGGMNGTINMWFWIINMWFWIILS